MDGTDFLIALLFVEVPALLVEVRDAGEEILCPGEDQPLDVGQQLSPEPLASGPVRHAKQFQIVAEQKLPANNRDAGYCAVFFYDIAIAPLREREEIAVLVFGLIAQPFPGVRAGE